MFAKISIPPDCGNSPRKKFVADMLVAIAEGDRITLSKLVPESPVWNQIGEAKAGTSLSFHEAIEKSVLWKSKTLSIDRVITHGPDASSNGMVTSSKGTQIAFCHIISFSSAAGFKVTNLTSFVVAQ